MTEKFLDKAYQARDAASTRTLYDDWSASYDAEVSENGYATPKRCAEALASFTQDMSAPILDFGCGTGLSGLALKLAGFEVIDGVGHTVVGGYLLRDVDVRIDDDGYLRAVDILQSVQVLAAEGPRSCESDGRTHGSPQAFL